VLWKMAKPGEPSWDSPWGQGRPGWHIECSAMSTCCLGNHFDIHGGGMDLQFPHHENEIAQSEGATGETFVNVWMHNCFVRVDNEKMSKSLGNFFTIREVFKRYEKDRDKGCVGEIIRFFILTSHYRSPLNFSNEQLDDAKVSLSKLYIALDGVPRNQSNVNPDYLMQFEQAMDDDFNTHSAILVLQKVAYELNKVKGNDKAEASYLAFTLIKLGGLLGILRGDPKSFLRGHFVIHTNIREAASVSESSSASSNASPDYWIELEIQKRLAFKKHKHWDLADQIRVELKEKGIILEDRPDGTTSWRRE